MKVVITPMAQVQLEHQLGFGIDRHGLVTAQKTFARVERFFATTLVDYPRTGTFLPDKRLYESFIPRTPFIVIYRIEAEAQIVRVLGFFHHAQDRTEFEPSE
jgi:plasmid stabilization system protein ParE